MGGTNNSCDYQPTQYNVITGDGSGAINNVSPSSTSGVPLISQGASSQPAFGTAVVAGGGTGLTSATAYAVLCGGTTSTGAFQSVASVGTAGQVLVSNGAGALPTFQASSGSGSLVLLQSQNASSSASIAFSSTYITSTYNSYLILMSAIVPATNAASLQAQISTNNGSSYVATGYESGFISSGYNSTTLGNVSSTTLFYIFGTIANTANLGLSGTFYLFNAQNSNDVAVSSNGTVQGSGGINANYLFSGNVTTANINNIKFFMSSGNISAGTFTLFGIVE